MKLLNTSATRVAALTLLAGATLAAQVPRDRPAAPPSATGTGVISGRMMVMLATGPAPVRRARVVLDSAALKQPLTTDTDTEGRYRFTELPPGAMRIRGEKAGVVPRMADPRRAFEPPAPIDLKAGQSMTVDLAMQPGAALEGRILKDNGDPAANMIVSAVRLAYDVNGRRPTAARQGRTDDLGRFRVHTLPPGEYRIDAAPDPLDALRQMPTPGARPPVPSHTYYPGSARLEDARVVAVAVGETSGNLDFTMTSVTMSSLRGKVTLSDGRPANGPGVRLQRVGGVVGEVRGGSSIASNDFNYATVPAGEFWMMAVARSAPGAEIEYGVTRLTIDGRDVPGFSIATAKQPPIGGRVEGIAIPAGLQVTAIESSFEWPGIAGDPPPKWTAPVAPDGTFAFTALPGPRLIRVTGLPANAAIRSIFLGETDVTDTPFEIKAGETPPAIRIVLSTDTATLSGVLKDASGKLMSGARVVVFSDDERQWRSRSRMISSVEAGADGTYEIAGLLPGTYRVIAVSFLETLAWTDATVLHQLTPDAQVVTLVAGRITMPLVVKR